MKILDIDEIYKVEVGKLLFKREKDFIPVGVANHFKFNIYCDIRYGMRGSTRTIDHPKIKYKTKYGDSSLHIRGSTIWNNISDSIWESENPRIFKARFKKTFFEQQ